MIMAKKEEFTNQTNNENKSCKCECGHSHEEVKGDCCCTEDGACFCDCHEESPEIENLKAELEKAREEAKKSHDNFLRSLADLDTFRRRVQRDMEDIRKFSVQPIVEELIPAIDNLELGLDHAKKGANVSELVVGIEMVLTQIKKVFENFGVVEISPLGLDFDPNFHDSVAFVPSNEFAENKVSSIMRKGYTLNGRLVRPASVVVSSGAKKE